MTKPRSQNSLLVLATLGVYFGLLAAGASPVFGHAATARTFDLRDEIEFADDLDNKPDDGRSPVTASVQIYLEDLDQLFASLGRLGRNGAFDARRDTFDVAQATLLPCIDSNLAGRYTPLRFFASSENSRSALEYFSRGLIYGYSLGDCVVNGEFDGTPAVESKFNYKLDEKAFAVNVMVRKSSPLRAIELQRSLDATLALYATRTAEPRLKRIIENTRFRSVNEQVSIDTRLPRGSLAALLATDAR